jgi:hypothetical protein
MIWEGNVQGVQWLLLNRQRAEFGSVLSGKLPEVPCTFEVLSGASRVETPAIELARNRYTEVRLSVRGNRVTRLILRWTELR